MSSSSDSISNRDIVNRSNTRYDSHSPLRSPAEVLQCPYVLGATFTAHRHQPPPPFGGNYSSRSRPNQDDLRDVSQLEWCITNPPAAGSTIINEAYTFTIISTIRTGSDCGAQLVRTNDGLVAKIYDPLFYSFRNRMCSRFRVDVAFDADSDYAREAAAYQALQGTFAEDNITARYHKSWTIDIVTNLKGKDVIRAVRLILVEYVPGTPMADIDPDSLTAEEKERIMFKVIEADYDLRRAGVKHEDIAPRNIILSDRPDTTDTHLRVIFVDLGHSTVFKIRFGRPALWEMLNPLFEWSSPSEWTSMGWVPDNGEEGVNKRWELWGEGRDGKYTRVERDSGDWSGRPIYPNEVIQAARCRSQLARADNDS